MESMHKGWKRLCLVLAIGDGRESQYQAFFSSAGVPLTA